jgi:Leucine-rich repeat (LRR) protein
VTSSYRCVHANWIAAQKPCLQILHHVRACLVPQSGSQTSQNHLSMTFHNVQGVPKSVLANVDRVRVLDVSSNNFEELPAAIDTMINLERLNGSHNRVKELDIQFESLTKLKVRCLELPHLHSHTCLACIDNCIYACNQAQLLFGQHRNERHTMQVVDLDGNQLVGIPEDIGCCSLLESLRLRGNRLRSIPPTLQKCTKLKILDVANNRLTCLPPPIGNCASLESIDASGNMLVDIPGALSRLTKLRVLLLKGNSDLKGIPGEVLVYCELLHTLDLHDTMVTREVRSASYNACLLQLRACTV